jgi:small-conductance mechanosensitive channel
MATSVEHMKTQQRAIFTSLAALLIITLGAAIFTRDWSNYRERMRAIRAARQKSSETVDTRTLDMAQQLSTLAVTHTEQDYALDALRLADLSVDLAFQAALRDATENPAPLTPQTEALSAKVKAAEDSVAADQDRVTQLTQQVAKARGSSKDALQEDLELQQAQLSLDQDELEDAQQDLMRAGGDKRATIQQLLDQHEASEQHTSKANGVTPSAAAPPSPESTTSSSVLSEVLALLSLHSKQKLLVEAEQDALSRQSNLTGTHEKLEKEVEQEKAEKKILHKRRTAEPASANPASTPNPALSAGQGDKASTIAFLRDLAEDQKNLSSTDKRIETEQELAAVYGNWITFVAVRERAFLHELFLSSFWIFLIALFVYIANYWIRHFFADIGSERRHLLTMRAMVVFGIQALGLILILFVIFGTPSNLGTVAALAGAGLTVALKDFILGFIGWFILMGKDGIRPGDWVEINGVGGEVLEVGPFHTVLLETGNWADAAHPTGRKVTFVNSFAVEGHYFNFSTSGQWLWDELQVQVPQGADPYPVAEAIKKIATDDTVANSRDAEQEWERVVPAHAKRTFSAAPSMSVRPTEVGMKVVVRYITRASERQDVRGRIYHAVVELLRKKNFPEPAPEDLQAGATQTEGK